MAVTPLSDLPVDEDEDAAAAADLFREGVPEEGGEGGPDVLPLVTGRGDPTTATWWNGLVVTGVDVDFYYSRIKVRNCFED